MLDIHEEACGYLAMPPTRTVCGSRAELVEEIFGTDERFNIRERTWRCSGHAERLRAQDVLDISVEVGVACAHVCKQRMR